MKMNRFGHERVQLWAGNQVVVVTGKVFVVRRKRSMKVNANLISGGSVCRYPSRRVERSLCRLCRKRRNKLNRCSDEQVHLCRCRTV